MNFKDVVRKYGAYAAAVAIFVLAAVIYCSPALSGKIVYAGDVQNYIGVSHESWQYLEETGEQTFWNSAVFSGMPNYQIGGGRYEAENLLKPFTNGLNHRDNPIRILLLYLLCFYIMMRCFGVDKWVSIAGAFAVTLSSYFLVIIPAGHMTKISSIAYYAVVLGAFNLIMRKKYIPGIILASIFATLAFKPHPQMFYYFTMLLGVLWIAQGIVHIKEKRYKDFGLATAALAFSFVLAIGCNSANLFANAEYAKETIRGGHSDIIAQDGPQNADQNEGLDIEYATQWSYGIDETLSLLIPGFKGGANSVDVGTNSVLYKELSAHGVGAATAKDFCTNAPMYWGDQPFTAGNVYAGAIIVFLFCLGLCIVKGPYKWGLLAATLFSIMLAWGHNFLPLTELFFKYFPKYSMFRAVSSILVVAEVAMPLLGFLALKEIFDGKVEKTVLLKKINLSAGITAGICMFFALMGGALFSFTSVTDSFAASLPDWAYDAICAQRESILRKDSLRSGLFIVATALVLRLFIKGKMNKGWFAAALTALIILDMWPVDKRYFNDSHFISPRQNKQSFEMTDYEREILQDKSNFRVMNLTTNTFNDARTSYYLKSVGGYCAVKLRRYNDLIEQHLSKMHLPVIGMLNAKYLIIPGEGGQTEFQENPYTLGNAWFVDKLHVVDNANEESDALMKINLTHEAVVDRSFEACLPAYSPTIPNDADITQTLATPKDLEYSFTSPAPATVVFSEIYYPYGWKATLDGEPAEHYRANYLLRAMNVPAGQHTIHFTFDPDSVRKGNTLAMICIIIMYLMTAAGIVYGICNTVRKRKNEI